MRGSNSVRMWLYQASRELDTSQLWQVASFLLLPGCVKLDQRPGSMLWRTSGRIGSHPAEQLPIRTLSSRHYTKPHSSIDSSGDTPEISCSVYCDWFMPPSPCVECPTQRPSCRSRPAHNTGGQYICELQHLSQMLRVGHPAYDVPSRVTGSRPFVCDNLHAQSKVTRCSTLTMTDLSTSHVIPMPLA